MILQDCRGQELNIGDIVVLNFSDWNNKLKESTITGFDSNGRWVNLKGFPSMDSSLVAKVPVSTESMNDYPDCHSM